MVGFSVVNKIQYISYYAAFSVVRCILMSRKELGRCSSVGQYSRSEITIVDNFFDINSYLYGEL
jgi:hypothetical protein